MTSQRPPAPPTILLVEDDSVDAMKMKRELARNADPGTQVEIVSTVGAALAQLERISVDLILLDLNLPDSVGIDTFFRVERAAQDVSIVVLTGMEDPISSLAAMRAGAEDFFVKGELRPESIARAVRRAVERRAAQERRRHEERQLEESERARRMAGLVTDLAGELDVPVGMVVQTSEHVARRLRAFTRALERWEQRALDPQAPPERRRWIEDCLHELRLDFPAALEQELDEAEEQARDAARRTREILSSMRRYLDLRAQT